VALYKRLPRAWGASGRRAARYGEDDFYVGTCYPDEERLPAVPPEHGPWSTVALRPRHWRQELDRNAMLRFRSEAKKPVRHGLNPCATPWGVGRVRRRHGCSSASAGIRAPVGPLGAGMEDCGSGR